MIKFVMLTITITFGYFAGILNRIMAYSQTPELGWVVIGTFLVTLAGTGYLSLSTLNNIREWRERQSLVRSQR
jgi:hypothetical protein